MNFDSCIEFSGRTAIVTGGGGGVGFGICQVLAACGATVALVGRSDTHQRAAEELGEPAFSLKGDVADNDDCERVVEEVVSRFGKLDILVNNAAAPPIDRSGALNQSLEDFKSAIEVSILGAYQMSLAAGRVMVKQQDGAQVNISSIGSVRSFGLDASYMISKAALNMMTKDLGSQWGPEGVRVNGIIVGYIDAGMAENEDREFWLSQIPLRRTGKPTEIGWAVAWLASDMASYVNGTNLAVDGGLLAC